MNILITGGTGSLGHALLRRIYGQHNITILSRDETKQGKTRTEFPNCRFILGDVANLSDLELAFRGIDIVYHFAAYKQVPSAQNNVSATIKTNITGSQNVALAAIKNNVKQVVASSTDKACAPVNMYGISKAAMESVFQDANKYGPTTFHLARYGNVVASNASVVPLFKKQAAAGGPLTVTHPDMTRFWISIDTAVDLVQHALTTAPGIIVVPAAKAMNIVKVARLFGEGLPVKNTGIRPGEKIHESMVSEAESFYTEVYDFPYDVEHIDKLFYIHPPTELFRNTKAPFVYTSDGCPALSSVEFLEML